MSTAVNAEVLEELRAHREDFRLFQTELLGGVNQDKPNGRIPLLEAASARQEARIDSHDARLRRLEHFVVMVVGAAALLKAVGWCAESLYHIIHVFHP